MLSLISQTCRKRDFADGLSEIDIRGEGPGLQSGIRGVLITGEISPPVFYAGNLHSQGIREERQPVGEITFQSEYIVVIGEVL